MARVAYVMSYNEIGIHSGPRLGSLMSFEFIYVELIGHHMAGRSYSVCVQMYDFISYCSCEKYLVEEG